jgi:hypothetical protein
VPTGISVFLSSFPPFSMPFSIHVNIGLVLDVSPLKLRNYAMKMEESGSFLQLLKFFVGILNHFSPECRRIYKMVPNVSLQTLLNL